MCRNIKSLYNFDPPATDEEIQAAALQFVRKISGFYEPSSVNKAVFNQGLSDITKASKKLLGSLVTKSPVRNREFEITKARARSEKRFGIKT